MTEMTVFVCEGDQSECWNCGGWVHAGDLPEVPVGESPIGGHYCSTGCHDEALTFMEQQEAARVARTRCCSACGFDNQEHADDCPGEETS